MTAKVVSINKRRYEAGSKSPRLDGWATHGTDATAAIRNLSTIRNRSRDLVRNNPWAAKIVSTLVNNTVGYGIRASLTGPKGKKTKLARAWKAWAESTLCDFDGRMDLYGLQQLAFRTAVESGECLVRKRPIPGAAIPLQLQLLEPDYLDETHGSHNQTLPGGGVIRRGIEFDASGKRVAYHIRKYHPGNDLGQFQWQSDRIPASEIIHLFRVDRPGQIRGVPWLAPIVVTLREMDIFEDAYLKRQQVGNLFAGFLQSEDPETNIEEMQVELPELEPGTFYAIKSGRRIEFSEPPKSDPYALEYMRVAWRRLAAGVGLSYEAFTGDLSQVNFSSGRMGAQEMGRCLESWQYQMLIPQMCATVFEWFADAAFVAGLDPAGIAAGWTPPARTLVDPTREYAALKEAVRDGFLTHPEAVRSLGYDPETHYQEIADSNAVLDGHSLILDTDPRHVAAGGTLQNADTADTQATGASAV